MSFIPIINLKQVKNYTASPKFGTVIDNNDPLMLGRVKVHIPGIFDGAADALPWIRRKMDTVFCGLHCEIFDVPEIDSIIQVQWDYDAECPVYTGAPYNQKHQTSAFTENYPYEGGIKFGNCLIKFDKGSNIITIEVGDTSITLDDMGYIRTGADNIVINANHTVDINAPNVTINGNLSVNGTLASSKAASGLIGMNSQATVSNGMVIGIKGPEG